MGLMISGIIRLIFHMQSDHQLPPQNEVADAFPFLPEGNASALLFLVVVVVVVIWFCAHSFHDLKSIAYCRETQMGFVKNHIYEAHNLKSLEKSDVNCNVSDRESEADLSTPFLHKTPPLETSSSICDTGQLTYGLAEGSSVSLYIKHELY